jgi:ABC-2 type transport system permease protein
MLDGILTMMWKERRSLLRHKGSRTRFVLLLSSPALIATVFAWQWGSGWMSQIPPLALSVIVPLTLVAVLIPESFAGERERHTLETLLASCLPDRAILFGKMALPVAVGWLVTILFLLLSMVVVNLTNGESGFLFFSTPVALGSLALSFLTSTLIAGAGVLVSLRAETVQQAAQVLITIFLAPFLVIQVVPLLFRDRIGDLVESVDGPQLLVIVVASLAVLDAAVLLLTIFRFRRSRLALE